MMRVKSIFKNTFYYVLVGFALINHTVQAESYKIDPTHSLVQFTAGHLGFSYLVGRFNQVEGQFAFDSSKPNTGTASVVVKSASVDTNHDKRDRHLRSPDFFNAKQFPLLTFKSTGFRGAKKGGKLTGKLTILGVTREVTFEVNQVGEGKDPWGGYRNGYTATATIKRSDFGMKFSLPSVRDEVKLLVQIEGVRQKLE